MGSKWGSQEGPGIQVLVSNFSLPLAHPIALTSIVSASPSTSWLEWV